MRRVCYWCAQCAEPLYTVAQHSVAWMVNGSNSGHLLKSAEECKWNLWDAVSGMRDGTQIMECISLQVVRP
uniref:SCP domain-containing protein n=1 Tax=Ascaris lumbricoides TaxID=6252 RepID=A0A0M3IER9_ASCLU